MNIVEVNMNIFSAPQGYYLAQAISRDKNFRAGLPAQFEKVFDVSKKLQAVYDSDLTIGEAYLTGNLFSLVVKDSSYDAPDRDALMDSIVSMRDIMEAEGINKLAIPKLCCGKMGLEWDEVKAMFEIIFDDSDMNIIVCCQ